MNRLTVYDVLRDPAASSWLKSALRTALMIDPVDVANQAEVLAQVLAARAEGVST